MAGGSGSCQARCVRVKTNHTHQLALAAQLGSHDRYRNTFERLGIADSGMSGLARCVPNGLQCSVMQLGDGNGEGPPLWGVAELAAPLVARLRRHFGGEGMPTDRADRPEWLFATAARLAADLGPALSPLQPAIAAAELAHAYAIQVGALCEHLGLLCSSSQEMPCLPSESDVDTRSPLQPLASAGCIIDDPTCT